MLIGLDLPAFMHYKHLCKDIKFCILNSTTRMFSFLTMASRFQNVENHRIFSKYSLVYLLPFAYRILLPFILYFPSFYTLFCFLFVPFFCIYIGVSILCNKSIQ